MTPPASTYMLAPTSSGADPSIATSSPAATRRPSSSQSRTVAAVCCAVLIEGPGLLPWTDPDSVAPCERVATGAPAPEDGRSASGGGATAAWDSTVGRAETRSQALPGSSPPGAWIHP